MAMVALSLILMLLIPRISTALTCPSSCSFISPVPYPFGAAPGCGAPGFLLSNCSVTPQWNLQLSGTLHIYYVRSINPYPNPSQQNSSLSLGYGGSIILSLTPISNTPFPLCQVNAPVFTLTAFSSSNLFAFQEATLRFYQDKYLLFNCTGSTSQVPPSGIFLPSSTACNTYLKHCNIPTTGQCIEYAPDQDLYLPTLLTTYSCSSFRRFIVAHDDDPVETWITGTQFAWGPVNDADRCSKCQNTGGTCGYDTQDNSFLCYCGNQTYQTNCDDKPSGRKGLVVGVSCAAIFLLVVAAGITMCFHYRLYYWWVFKNHKSLKLDGINQSPMDLPYGALAAATRNFSTEIGRGAFGKVYKGLLADGSEVAVKVLDASMSHSNEQFVNEVATIGNIHHLNVARLFGFCFNKSKRILVYEYVSNGSLDKHLFSSSQSSDKVVLSWKQRFNIALGIARGLCYMHEECRNRIIHCDIKPQNILLDAAYCPKISDFGLAKLLTREESRVLTQARGTPGYVAPEFWSLGSGPLTSKFDVYSFGMVLLEIVRGKRSFHQLDPFSLEESDEELNEWTSVSIDKRLLGDADLEQAHTCTLVAFWCIQEDPSLRPTMSRVVQYLQGAATVPTNPPPPFRKMRSLRGTEAESEPRSLLSISSEGY